MKNLNKINPVISHMLSRVSLWLNKSAFFRSVLMLTSASMLSQGIVFLGLPLISRVYDPHDFGLFAIFNAIAGVLLTISSMRFELSIPVASSRRNASYLFFISVIITVLLACFSIIVIGIFGNSIAALFAAGEGVVEILWLLPLVLLSGGLFKALSCLALRGEAFKSLSVSKVLQGLLLVISQITLGILGIGPAGLVLGFALGQLAGVIWLALKRAGLSHDLVLIRSRSRVLTLLRQNKNYAKYDVPAAVTGSLSQHLPSVVLAALFSPVAAGLYYMAERVLAVPASLLGRSVGQVIHANIRSDLSSGHLEKRMLFILGCLVGVTFLPALLLHYFATPIFHLFLGESWRQTGEIASWLVFGVAMQFVYSALSIVLVTTGGQLKNLFIHSLLFLLKLFGILVGYKSGSFVMAIQGLVIAQVIGYGVALLTLTYHVRRFAPDGFKA